MINFRALKNKKPFIHLFYVPSPNQSRRLLSQSERKDPLLSN